MESIELIFELLEKDHIPGLQSLYKEIFNKKTEPDYFLIKYGLMLEGQKQLSIVAKHEGEVIGFFGAIPQVFFLEGKPYKFAYTCDYFIRKKYRGKNVFSKLYQELLVSSKKQGFDYFYAFDSEQTHKFARKNGWTTLDPFVGYELKTFPQVLKSILTRITPKNWSDNQLKKHLRPYLIELTANESTLTDGTIRYDDHFFKMKYLKDKYFIELHGCKLWLKHDYRITVGFFSASSEANVGKMIKSLRVIARKSGIHHVVFHFRPEDPEREKIEAFLTPFPSYKVSILQISESVPEFDSFRIPLMNGDVF